MIDPFNIDIPLNQTTPSKIGLSINRFINKTIKSHGKPVFLPFTHVSDKYLSKHCHSNCEAENIINKYPVIFGWIIWEDKPKKFIEAEFHAVIKINNNLIDITPRIDNEKLILFVPDNTRKAKRIDDRTWETWTNFQSIMGVIRKYSVKDKLKNMSKDKWI